MESTPISLSRADLSFIRLALEHKIPIATDDKPLRQFAKNLGISIVGSLGLLKSLYQSKIPLVLELPNSNIYSSAIIKH